MLKEIFLVGLLLLVPVLALDINQIATILPYAGSGGGGGGGTICGDGKCNKPLESYLNCPQDCPIPVNVTEEEEEVVAPILPEFEFDSFILWFASQLEAPRATVQGIPVTFFHMVIVLALMKFAGLLVIG